MENPTDVKLDVEENLPQPPVMDVSPPHNNHKSDADVAPAPPQSVVEQAQTVTHSTQKAKSSKQPGQSRQPGVGAAITATVIIVLGLAALATYAYLKSQ